MPDEVDKFRETISRHRKAIVQAAARFIAAPLNPCDRRSVEKTLEATREAIEAKLIDIRRAAANK